jgi:hypothetical protein
MDALQLRYPEIVNSDPKRKFCIFYVLKVSEMLWNTPKHHFGSNGVEWMLNNSGTPKWRIQDRNTSLASFYVPKVGEMLWNTPKHHFGSNGVECMLYNLVPWSSVFRPETQVLHLLRAEGSRNALKHSQTSFWVQWSRMDALQLRYLEIVHQVWNTSFASSTCWRLAKCSETLPNIILGPME